MTSQQKENLSNNILSVDILIGALVTLGKDISFCAYNSKKYQHAQDFYACDLKEHMQNRKYITDFLVSKYDMESDVIKDTVSGIDKKTISQKAIVEIVKLIRNGNYKII